jgi:hypothetical protein
MATVSQCDRILFVDYLVTCTYIKNTFTTSPTLCGRMSPLATMRYVGFSHHCPCMLLCCLPNPSTGPHVRLHARTATPPTSLRIGRPYRACKNHTQAMRYTKDILSIISSLRKPLKLLSPIETLLQKIGSLLAQIARLLARIQALTHHSPW